MISNTISTLKNTPVVPLLKSKIFKKHVIKFEVSVKYQKLVAEALKLVIMKTKYTFQKHYFEEICENTHTHIAIKKTHTSSIL